MIELHRIEIPWKKSETFLPTLFTVSMPWWSPSKSILRVSHTIPDTLGNC